MSLIIALEYNPFQRNGRGALAIMITRRPRWRLRLFWPWCVRGFNQGYPGHGKVAIASGIRPYRVDLLYGKFPRLLLVGSNVRGERLEGGAIPTIRPNAFQQGQYFADRIWIHGMQITPSEKSEYNTREYIGSSACHGPNDNKIDRLMEGLETGHRGRYLLIRPTEPLERLLHRRRHRAGTGQRHSS